MGAITAANALFDFRVIQGASLRFTGIARNKGAELPEGFSAGRVTVRIRPLLRRSQSELCATEPEDALDVARNLFERNGALLIASSLPVMEKMRYRDTGGGSFIFYTAIINGHVRVTDRDRFQSAHANGLGRGKAFGCGMIVLL
ncbi:MAG: type I-E CRISPR-associated protein Cas6/Cse3/CasE [Acidithiobacillus sp.]